MGAIVGTKTYAGELSCEVKLIHVTATLAAASDTITLTAAAHAGAVSIVGVLGANIKTGATTTFQFLQVSHSGLEITVASFGEDGGAATTFGDIELTLLVKTTA